MKILVKMLFGSHLYGTNTPLSDLDYKSVFIPSEENIILQQVRDTINHQRAKAEGEKNFAGEYDLELYSLQKFLNLCSDGQTVSLDMLFAPESMFEFVTPEWRFLQQNSSKLITRKSASFVGYCRTQANKYGIKGSRVAAVDEALKWLEHWMNSHPHHTKLGDFSNILEKELPEHMQILDIEGAEDTNGNKRSVRHWEVCNRKMPYTSSIKNAYEIMKRMSAEYGHRARQAQQQEGVDWKALSHAVRVGNEAIELLTTGKIIFPLENAEHLKDIKLGKLSYQEVANEIEDLLEQVEETSLKSTLPETADRNFIDAFIFNNYKKQIVSSPNYRKYT